VRRELAYLGVIVAVAFGIRVYGPWNDVFDTGRVNFLENDAWYHVRLIENQVRNWPWRVTLDPYAASGGQFVPIAPLFDTLTASIAVVAYGRDADAVQIERIAAFLPPVLGALTIVAVWGLARRAFDWRAALLAAALLAVLPGHFLDRTLLGFYDHHALEACLAIATLWALAAAIDRAASKTSLRNSVVAGVVLGFYLLSWSSGAFLVAILGAWLALLVLLAKSSDDLRGAARVTGVAALTAFVLVVAFQDRAMFRYQSQILGLVALAGMALAMGLVRQQTTFTLSGRTRIYGAMTIVIVAATAVIFAFASSVLRQLITDVVRLAPDPGRMAVLEARPLFLYPGNWNWKQPWVFFRTGFFAGLIGLIVFSGRVWRRRDAVDVLIWVFASAMFAATIGQNRFGYYLVPACALLAGWLASRVLDWGGVPHAAKSTATTRPTFALQRELAVIIVAAGVFAPNLVPGVLVTSRPASLPVYWRNTMAWLRDHTPPPFAVAANAGDDYYYARYPRTVVPPPDYTVMNWWDHGYWVIQLARRVPVANPTQERAPNAARFYAATTERDAIIALAAERSRYIVADWELPFRLTADGTVMGRFQNVVDWASGRHSAYYEVFYKRDAAGWTPVWVFYEPYYRSMTFRLTVLGGKDVTPARTSSVVTVVERVDDRGMKFKEILTQATYESYEAAMDAAKASNQAGRAIVVGLDPWRSAFPIEPLATFDEVFAARTPEQKPTESPWVRVFERR
jgi:dolichyl-phosphooligosaccharide-protein glycotransferase